MILLQNYINGELVAPQNGQYLDNYEPATGKVYAQIPDSDAQDVEAAVQAAQAAFPAWSSMTNKERGKILMRLSNLIEAQLEELALAESTDNGKPVQLARVVDIPRAASNFHFYATAIEHYASHAHAMTDQAINYTLRDAIGVVGCISPWNLPLYLFSWKIAPALAAGNCVVAKPSEVTPMTAYLLSKLCREAGLPAGVLNIVHGLGHKAGNAIVEHPQVKAISFTGGTKTGQHIASIAAPMFKKLSLELGGKNPNIIFADCDYEQMLATTLRSSFANQGQICLCGSRIFVERSLYARFKADFVAKVEQMVVGDPKDKGSTMGALVSKAHLDKVLSYVQLAQEEGGTILAGGKPVVVEGRCEGGYFMRPTVIEGLTADCRTNQEEIFGPVVTIMPFDTEAEVLAYANGTAYGLASTIWTSHIGRATRLAQQIHAGIVWVNCWLLRDLRTPFGGVKASGVGREGGFHALDFFTEPKNVCIKY
jgi:aminomuconate-semialdehyde/2-hydroxymuconate-6-semialdehyde dehydrogenase